MPYCAVKWCGKCSITSSLTKDGVTFHRFPKCFEIKQKWINATKRDDNWFPAKYHVICSRHFTEDCFRPSSGNRRFLFDTAVPTLMLPCLVFQVDGSENWLKVIPQPGLSPRMDEQTSENESSDSQRKRKTKCKSTPTRPKFQKLDSDSDETRFIEISIPQHPEIETTNNDSSRLDKSIQDYIDNQQKNVLRSLQDLSSNLRALSSRGDDVFDSFGKYVAGLLRNLPHTKALEVQPQIVDLITAAGLANIASQRKEVKLQEVRPEVRREVTPEVIRDIDICDSVVVKIESI